MLGLVIGVGSGCSSRDESPPTKRVHAKSPDPTQLTGQARGQRMLLEARNCVIGPTQQRARACHIACELAHSNSCYYLGKHLENGAGLTRNPAQALRRYVQGCNGGSGLACRGAGHMHVRGIGTPVDASTAKTLYARGLNHGRVHCEQGHAASCLAIGEMFARGEGGSVNVRAASVYLTKACGYELDAACAALKKLGK